MDSGTQRIERAFEDARSLRLIVITESSRPTLPGFRVGPIAGTAICPGAWPLAAILAGREPWENSHVEVTISLSPDREGRNGQGNLVARGFGDR